MYKQNDIFVFYEIINDIKPEKVLDVGMFLKCVGSVSRKAMSTEIDEKIWLTGIDLMPVIQFPVLRSIYDEIYTIQEFICKEESITKYDLGIYLKVENRKLLGKEMKIMDKILSKCCYFFSNDRDLLKVYEKKVKDTITVNVENNEYYILILKN